MPLHHRPQRRTAAMTRKPRNPQTPWHQQHPCTACNRQSCRRQPGPTGPGGGTDCPVFPGTDGRPTAAVHRAGRACTANGTQRSTLSRARISACSTCTTCCTRSRSPKCAPSHPAQRILDVGCGGGFPGIPLAILFPETQFTLIDSIGKKIKVVNEVAQGIGLRNLTAIHGRAEAVQGKFDFVVSRAVTEMKPFIGWIWDKIEPGNSAGTLANGILYLKGGRPRSRTFGNRQALCAVRNRKIIRRQVFRDEKSGLYSALTQFPGTGNHCHPAPPPRIRAM